jgi:hypothetical protein
MSLSRQAVTSVAREIVDRIRVHDLDLSGLSVLTEAATGAYAVTSVIAATAGASVVAFGKDSHHGTILEAWGQTSELAQELGVLDRIQLVDALDGRALASADIVTNSGHLRPLSSAVIEAMKPSAVIPLMYESWELRSDDVDVDACRRKRIRVAGTNERHPDVDVFRYLGLLVVKAALEEGFGIVGDRCLVISDIDFGDFISQSLSANGAEVTRVEKLNSVTRSGWDIVVIATLPPSSGGRRFCLDGVESSLFCQVWGDVDRHTAIGPWCPVPEPLPGHMGLTLDSLGNSPVVRLQTAGLKCGELMLRQTPDDQLMQLVQWVNPPIGGAAVSGQASRKGN